MTHAAVSRRAFLVASAATLIAHPAAGAEPALITTAKLPDGRFAVIGLDATDTPTFAEALPSRGHGLTRHRTTGDVVVLARRPGRFGYVIAPGTGRVRTRLDVPETRHLYGHGAFSADGRLLFTSENALDQDRGVLGIWDVAAGYTRVGEIDSRGIGPHDLARPGTDSRIWIANGGILTHPDTGRAKLNIPTMAPSLARFDPASGSVEIALELPHEMHKLSMRHLAASSRVVCVAMQYEGPETDPVPLLALRTAAGDTRLLALPEQVALGSRGYCGDVALDRSGSIVGAGFPRGGFFAFWTVEDGRCLGTLDAIDGCGIGPGTAAHAFTVSTGTGRMGHVSVSPDRITAEWSEVPSVAAFDNHLLA